MLLFCSTIFLKTASFMLLLYLIFSKQFKLFIMKPVAESNVMKLPPLWLAITPIVLTLAILMIQLFVFGVSTENGKYRGGVSTFV